MTINKKSFVLLRKVGKSFRLLIDGFSVSDTIVFFARIPKFKIVFLPKYGIKLISAIKLGKLRIAISKFTVQQKPIVTIALKRFRLTTLSRMKLSEKWTESFSIISPQILPIVRSTERWFSSIINLGKMKFGKIIIVFDIATAQYKYLSQTDLQTLGVLDLLTLGDMDYEIIG